VRAYFDVATSCCSLSQDWIRTLGKRIAKLHLKDFRMAKSSFEWAPLREGNLDWPEVYGRWPHRLLRHGHLRAARRRRGLSARGQPPRGPDPHGSLSGTRRRRISIVTQAVEQGIVLDPIAVVESVGDRPLERAQGAAPVVDSRSRLG